MGNFFNCKKVIDPSKIVNMPKDKKQEESEETEEYETYEYETETGEEEETSSGEEESSEEGETESSEEEETSSGEEESSSGEEESSSGEGEEEEEESSEYEYETSEYESEYETESSEQKPAAAAAVATSEPAKTTPPAKAAAAAAAPAQARVIVQAEEREVLQHGEQEHEWAPKRFLAEFIGTFALCWGIYMTRGNVNTSTVSVCRAASWSVWRWCTRLCSLPWPPRSVKSRAVTSIRPSLSRSSSRVKSTGPLVSSTLLCNAPPPSWPVRSLGAYCQNL